MKILSNALMKSWLPGLRGFPVKGLKVKFTAGRAIGSSNVCNRSRKEVKMTETPQEEKAPEEEAPPLEHNPDEQPIEEIVDDPEGEQGPPEEEAPAPEQ